MNNKKDTVTKLNNHDKKVLSKYAYSNTSMPDVNSAAVEYRLKSKEFNEK